jgi:hypothetical protein
MFEQCAANPDWRRGPQTLDARTLIVSPSTR